MKKRVVKKIANAYMRGKWWAGARDPYWWPTTSNGDGYLITEARLPEAVRAYLERFTYAQSAYSNWMDSPAVIDREFLTSYEWCHGKQEEELK